MWRKKRNPKSVVQTFLCLPFRQGVSLLGWIFKSWVESWSFFLFFSLSFPWSRVDCALGYEGVKCYLPPRPAQTPPWLGPGPYKEGRDLCVGARVSSGTGATSAAMDSSDTQRKKVAVIGGGLVSIYFSMVPVGGVTWTTKRFLFLLKTFLMFTYMGLEGGVRVNLLSSQGRYFISIKCRGVCISLSFWFSVKKITQTIKTIELIYAQVHSFKNM